MCIGALVVTWHSEYGSANFLGQLVVTVFVSTLAASILYRPSRVLVEATDSTIIVTPYRCFGLVPFGRKEFARNELGSLILDTQSRMSCFTRSNCCCYCCCGPNGLYVTKGLPRDEASVEIAFEIPFFHLTQYSFLYHPCHVRAFEASFHGLADCMGFISCGVISSHQQKTTPKKETVIIGTAVDHQMEMVHNMQYQMDAWNSDAQANFRNFMAFNPLCCTPATRPKGHGVCGGRAVYFFEESQNVAPSASAASAAPAPVAAPVAPAPPPATPPFAMENADAIRSRNKATVEQLFAALATNDCVSINQAIPSLYRGDYASSRVIDGQAPIAGGFSGLAGLFKYVIVDAQGKYYNFELLPEQDDNPYILRGRYRIRYPASDWLTSFTYRFDERAMLVHGESFTQRCS